MKEQRNRTIQDPGFSSSLLNLTELGVIPSANPQGPRLIAAGRHRDVLDPAPDSMLPSGTRPGSL